MPTSATDPTPVQVSASTSLEIVLIDPCKLTEMLEWNVNQIFVQFGVSESLEVVLAEVEDQSSLEFGNRDGFSLCGPRIYEIISQPQVY